MKKLGHYMSRSDVKFPGRRVMAPEKLPEKLLRIWTPETLARRIEEGENLLVEFSREPPWMGELVAAELVRKRVLLTCLRGRPATFT